MTRTILTLGATHYTWALGLLGAVCRGHCPKNDHPQNRFHAHRSLPCGVRAHRPRAFFACRPALLSRPRDGRRSFLVASQRPTTREKAATRLLLKVPRAASRESTLEIWQRLRRPEMCRMSMLLKISVTRTQLQPEVCGMFKRARSVVRSRPALPSLAPRVASPPFFQSCVLAHGLCRFRHP